MLAPPSQRERWTGERISKTALNFEMLFCASPVSGLLALYWLMACMQFAHRFESKQGGWHHEPVFDSFVVMPLAAIASISLLCLWSAYVRHQALGREGLATMHVWRVRLLWVGAAIALLGVFAFVFLLATHETTPSLRELAFFGCAAPALLPFSHLMRERRVGLAAAKAAATKD